VPDAFRRTTCPHGVDTTLRLITKSGGDAQEIVAEQTECLRCAEEAGHIVLMGIAHIVSQELAANG